MGSKGSLLLLKLDNYVTSDLPSEKVLCYGDRGRVLSNSSIKARKKFVAKRPPETVTPTSVVTEEPISTLEVSSTSSETDVSNVSNSKRRQVQLPPATNSNQTIFWTSSPVLDIPFNIRTGINLRSIGNIRIKMRVTNGNADVALLTNFWKHATAIINPMKQHFPSTDRDMMIVSSSVSRSVNSGVSQVADAFYQMRNGHRFQVICGCFLATHLTLRDFKGAMTQNNGGGTGGSQQFSSEWVTVLDLFRPVAGIIENFLKNLGNALFLNALIIDANVLQQNTPWLSLKIYKTLFGYSASYALKNGFKFALYIAKDKNEVIIFQTFGFKILRSMVLDQVNEITLMMWKPS